MRSRGLVVVLTVVAALLAVPAGAHADLTFNGTIEGRVTLWGTGEPVEGAEVRGVYEYGPVATTTDADGYYRLENLESGTYNVTFRIGSSDPFWYYPGTYTWSAATNLTITNDEVFSGIDGMVQEEGTMIGRVTDDTTGDPVAGMCADVYDVSDEVVGTAVSNSDGWLLYPDITVASDDQWLESSARIYDCNELGYADEWYRDVPIERGGGSFIVEYGSERGRFDAAVGAPGGVYGTVLDESDSPLDGACVSLHYQALDLGTDTTDSEGYFGFSGLTAGDRYTLDFEDCNNPVTHDPVSDVAVTVTSGTDTYVEQALEPATTISGTVTDASTGLPLQGICVLGTEQWFQGSLFWMDLTDAFGQYTLIVPPGTAHQYVRAYWCGETPKPYEEQWWDGVTSFEQATDLQMDTLEHRIGVDLAMPKMASLQGTLIGVDGLPAETRVWVSPQFEGAQFVPATTSNPDGTYRIDDIEPGPYLVGFGNDVRWSTYPVEWYDDAALEEDAAPVEFDYGDEVTIDAELEQVGVLEWNFDSVGFEAVAPICAYATNADGKRVAETTGTVGGATFLGGLPSGDYLLYAEGCDTSDPEVAPVWYPDATTRSGAEVLHVDGHLVDLGNWDLSDVIPGPSSVSGVTTLGGVAINACVTVFDEDMAVVGEAAAVDGSYSVDGLDLHGPEAGLYVKAEDCGDPTVAAWYGSATGQDASEIPYGAGLAWSDIDIELSGVETNELTVTVEDLLARPLASVCTVVSGDAEVDGRTGADGTVSFTLSDGDYTVTAGVAGTGCVTGYEEATESVSVAGPTSVSIALALPVEFADTQDSVFAADIDWLAGAGVTKGCNPPLNTEYCATQVVTRGQMAAFLARALSLTDRLDNPFTDDDGTVFEADIEKLAAAGITRGCNPPVNDMFCPDEAVTRGQMAAFLVRALGYRDAGDGDLFTDDDGSIFEDAIDKLATAGVTRGCNPPVNDLFCPNAVVTRGQMAAFLHRALG